MYVSTLMRVVMNMQLCFVNIILLHIVFQSCSEGMLVLGVIKSVTNYHLDVSLPNGITGRVPITAISDTYTELLKRLAKDDFIVEV